MRPLIITSLLLGASLFGSPSTSFADDTASPAIAAEQPQIQRTNLSAIRVGLANGVIQIVNNTRQATLKLEWDALPASPDLEDQILSAGRAPAIYTFELPNEALGKPEAWGSFIKGSERIALLDALKISDFSQFNVSTTNFTAFWRTPNPNTGYSLVGESILGRQYFGLLRDNRALTTLLESKGISALVNVEDAEAHLDIKGEKFTAFPHLIEHNITWEFRLFQFRVNSTVSYYRVAIKAKVRPFKVVLTDNTDTTVKVRIKVGFKDAPALAGLKSLYLGGGDLNVTLSAAHQGKLAALEDSQSLSSAEILLQNIGGTNITDLVTKGLLGGTQETSIVTGGLIGSGKVDQVIGVNVERGHLGGAEVGLLFGISPGSDNSIYLGPSLRSGVLMASIGARVYEKDKPNSAEKSTKPGLAGVLSVDLSRLTRQKQDAQPLKLVGGPTGSGDWGKATDELFKDLTLFRSTVQPTQGTTLPDGFVIRLTQLTKGTTALGQEKGAVVTLQLTAVGQQSFLPSGNYKVELGTLEAGQFQANPNFKLEPDNFTELFIGDEGATVQDFIVKQ